MQIQTARKETGPRVRFFTGFAAEGEDLKQEKAGVGVKQRIREEEFWRYRQGLELLGRRTRVWTPGFEGEGLGYGLWV